MIDIDLLVSVREQGSTARARAWACIRAYGAWAITLTTLVALLCVHLVRGRTERRLDRALARARAAASHMERSAQRVRALQEQDARLRSSELALWSVRSRARTRVAPALAVLSGALPNDVWLERVDVQRAAITIHGRGRSLSSFVALANELSGLRVFDGATDLREVRHDPDTAPDADGSVFTFILHGKLGPAEAPPARSTRP